MRSEAPTSHTVVFIFGTIGLFLATIILGLTTIDAYRDMYCDPSAADCWHTDWREVVFDGFMTLAAAIGCGYCLFGLNTGGYSVSKSTTTTQGDVYDELYAAQLEISRLRAALTLQASPFILKTPQEREINWERVMREVNRRQKLAKEALQNGQ